MKKRFRRLAEQVNPQLYAHAFWYRQFLLGRNLELRLIRRLVPRGAHVADIGADRGRYALFFRPLVGHSGLVQMFEPNPTVQAHLLRLAARYPNLCVHPFGLSSTDGTGVLHIPVINGAPVSTRGTLQNRRHGVGGQEHHIAVSLRRLDEVADHLSRPLDVIKCDVEGSELDVLRGAVETLAKQRPVLLIEIEERHCRDQFDSVLDLISSLDYEGHFFSAGQLLPLDRFDLNKHQLAYYTTLGYDRMPPAYVRDFLFLPRRRRDCHDRCRGRSESAARVTYEAPRRDSRDSGHLTRGTP